MVIRSDMLRFAEGARISYAQDGGKMRVKLSASDTATGDGRQIAKFDIYAEGGLATRLSDAISLNKDNIGDSKYLIVEFTVHAIRI